MRNCALCLKKGPHFHVIVEDGRVTSVEYISTKDYWNRELDKDEYTVGYRSGYKEKDDSIISRIISRFAKTR
jgi:hypothetical protein